METFFWLKSSKPQKYFNIGSNHAYTLSMMSVFRSTPKKSLVWLGESGSGKSTLGKTLSGLHDKTSGSISFAVKQLPQRYQAKDFRAMAPKMQMIFRPVFVVELRNTTVRKINIAVSACSQN